MTRKVFNALYNTVDSKTTEELLDIVDNRLEEYPDEAKWMIAMVLSKRKVEFSLDEFPPDFDYDGLFYYNTESHFETAYLILAGACALVALIICLGLWDDYRTMTMVSAIAAAAIGYCLKNGWKEEGARIDIDCTGVKSEYATGFVESQNNNKMQFTTTKDLIVGALAQLSCTPTVEEDSTDNGTVYYNIAFYYQGVFFVMRCWYGFPFVHLFCPDWHAEQLDNIRAVDAIKWTINEINKTSRASCYYVIDKAENTLNVCGAYDFYLFPEIPAIHTLFSTILTDFLKLRNEFFKLLNTGNPNNYAKTNSNCEDNKIYGEC